MKPMTRNLLLSALALLSALLVAFAFVRVTRPAFGGGTLPEAGGFETPPALPGEGGMTGGGDTPITDPKIAAEDDMTRSGFFDGEGRREERGRTSDALLPMIFASVGSALFTLAVFTLIVTNRKKKKEKFTSGGKSDDADLPIRTD